MKQKTIIAFRSIFFKLTENNNYYYLKERKTRVFVFTLILFPLFAINGILMFICQELEDLLTIRNSNVTTNRMLTKKEQKIIKKELLKN